MIGLDKRWKLVLVVVAAAIGLAGTNCDGGDDVTGDLRGVSVQELETVMAVRLATWEEALREESAAYQAWEEGVSTAVSPSERQGLDAARQEATEQRLQAERAATAVMQALMTRHPDALATRRAEVRYLAHRCAEVQSDFERLQDAKQAQRAEADPPDRDAAAERVQRIRELGERVAEGLTRLEADFPQSDLVRQLDTAVVRDDYRRLIRNLPAEEADLTPSQRTAVLDGLRDLKARYPLSPLTRRAERQIIPLTVPRSISDLLGWPLLVLILLVATLGAGWLWCLTGMLSRRRLGDDDGGRVLRPAMASPLEREQDLRQHGETPSGVSDVLPRLPRRGTSSRTSGV